jgi:large subunit ribosomal protein L13
MTTKTPTTSKTHKIDATGKRLGNLATETTTVLLGKDSADYARHLAADVTVEITNVSKLDIPERKKAEIYQTYSGHPGGRKTESLDHLATRRGYAEVVRRTIAGMLPNNKLKKVLLKQLVISE